MLRKFTSLSTAVSFPFAERKHGSPCTCWWEAQHTVSLRTEETFSRWEDVFHCLITITDLCYHKWMYLHYYSFIIYIYYSYFFLFLRKNISTFTLISVFVLWSVVAGKLYSFLCLQAPCVFGTIYIPCGTIILIFSPNNLMNTFLSAPEVFNPVAV